MVLETMLYLLFLAKWPSPKVPRGGVSIASLLAVIASLLVDFVCEVHRKCSKMLYSIFLNTVDLMVLYLAICLPTLAPQGLHCTHCSLQ